MSAGRLILGRVDKCLFRSLRDNKSVCCGLCIISFLVKIEVRRRERQVTCYCVDKVVLTNATDWNCREWRCRDLQPHGEELYSDKGTKKLILEWVGRKLKRTSCHEPPYRLLLFLLGNTKDSKPGQRTQRSNSLRLRNETFCKYKKSARKCHNER